jgi:hypothetical protein
MKSASKTKGIIWLVVAFLLFVADVFAIYVSLEFYLNSETATGVVTYYEVSTKRSRGGSSYLYTIEFKASDGKKYQSNTLSGSHEIGDEMTVRYDKRDPNYSFSSFWDLWIFVILLSPTFIITLLLGIWKIRLSKPTAINQNSTENKFL